MIGRDGSDDHQVTFGDDAYVEPDIHPSGRLVACRLRIRSDIWMIPADGTAEETLAKRCRSRDRAGKCKRRRSARTGASSCICLTAAATGTCGLRAPTDFSLRKTWRGNRFCSCASRMPGFWGNTMGRR